MISYNYHDISTLIFLTNEFSNKKPQFKKFPAPPPPPSEDLNQEVFERLTKEREDRIKEIELLRLERLEERKAAARAARQVDIVARIDAFRRTLDDANKKLNRPEVKKEKDGL